MNIQENNREKNDSDNQKHLEQISTSQIGLFFF